LIGMNDFFKHWAWLAGVLLVVAIFIFNRFRATEDGKTKIDQWKMGMPIVGKVVRLHLFGQFCRTLATLLQNGVPVLKAWRSPSKSFPTASSNRPSPRRGRR
jgi:type II secretory pathway component PulF